MPWTSYLPDSPERLSTIEAWLYFGVFLFGVLAAVSGYVAVEVRGYRANIEKKALEHKLSETGDNLSATRAELDETRKKAAETESAIKLELDKAHKKAEEIEARQAPRRLTSVQRRQLVVLLSGKSGSLVKIQATANNAEAMQYAMDLGHALQDAGWKVEGVGSVTILGDNPIGLFIYIKDQKSPPAGAQVLLESFRKAGLDVTTIEKSGVTFGTVVLMVGDKP